MNPAVCDAYIVETSAFLPNAPVDNARMESVLGMVGDVPSRVRNMILRSNGIRQRHYAIDPVTRQPTHSVAELAAEAVQQLFARGIAPQDVGSLACATSYPDQLMPGHGVMVHGLLPGLPACEVLSHAGVCVAGMASMKHAWLAVRSGDQQLAIACAAEAASAVMRKEAFQPEIDHRALHAARPDIAFEKDFLRWMLSDGAGAVCLAPQPAAQGLSFRVHWIDMVSYAHQMPVCMYAGAEIVDGRYAGWKQVDAAHCQVRGLMNVKQDVKLLNDNIVRYTVEKALQQVLARRRLHPDEVDHFLPHHSSAYFRQKLHDGLVRAGFPIPFERWFTNLASKGNTGSASIYIMLDEFRRTVTVEPGQKVLCYIPESGRFSSCFMLLEAVHGG